jgi:hypothetical protein
MVSKSFIKRLWYINLFFDLLWYRNLLPFNASAQPMKIYGPDRPVIGAFGWVKKVSG